MEKRAYYLAREFKCYDQKASQRIHMSELFDMIAGSESGAIIASTIGGPKKKSATEAVNFFNETVEGVYAERSMGIGLAIVFSLFIIGVLMGISYLCVKQCCYPK
jgi:hypothetical protein